MLIVNVAVPGDEFVATVQEISAWLAAEHISSPYSAFSGDKVHRTIRLGFDRDSEAEEFAKRFGGHVVPDGLDVAATASR